MRTALLVQYDGTAFSGWQLQEGCRTVQGEMERALGILTGEDIRVTASGRTDTGVHALGQVVHFDMKKELPLQRICIGMNGIMDRDVSVLNAFRTGDDFHARFSAVEREYVYIIFNHPLRSPFMQYRAAWLNYRMDENYIASFLHCLEGEHDFASFCKKQSVQENTVRRITGTEVRRRGDWIFVRIRANGFLHNMIRITMGTCFDLYRNHQPFESVLDILSEKDRTAGGVTAPPYGLYLSRIFFDSPLDSYPAAFAEKTASNMFDI